METNQIVRYYESQLENLQLENKRNRELVSSIFSKLQADNEVLLSIAKEYYLHLQKAANENVKNAISTDSERTYLRNTISKITGIECEILQNEIESEAIQKA